MPYILVRGNLASYSHRYPWRVLVSGLKASDIEQLTRFASGGYCDDSTIVYLQHPCVILTALEVLGYKVVASSSTSVKQDYNEYMWTMRKEFAEPEPEPIVKAVVDVHEHKVQLRKPDELENASETIHQPTSSGTGLAPNVVHDADSTLSLQTRILHEQLSEKRALRKIAELELQRKTLELERFQWEFERDRARSEETWAHESRLMQMKEEREQRLLQESCSYDTK